MKDKFIFMCLFSILLLSFVSAEIILVKPSEFVTGGVSNTSSLGVNATQMENVTLITIKETWIDSFWLRITDFFTKKGDGVYLYNDTDTMYFNETKLNDTIDLKLTSYYHNATQSSVTAGTIDGGTLFNTQHQDGLYDGKTFNFSEAAGSPGLDLRINFTEVNDFNQGVIRYKTSSLAGAYPIIQLWNYDTSAWEDYPFVGESETFATITQPVFDSTEHISGEVVQMRIYKASNGNMNNHYYVDWIAIVEGVGIPSGEEVDPFSIHRDGNTTLTGNWQVGGFNITNISWLEATNLNLTGNLTADWGFFNGSLMPVESLRWDIGSGAKRWRVGYFQNISADYGNFLGDLDVGGNVTADFFQGNILNVTYVNATNATFDIIVITNGTYTTTITSTTMTSDTLYAPLLQLGGNSVATGSYAVAIGLSANATGTSSFALGDLAHAAGTQGMALGSISYAGYRAAALGYWASASGTESLALGENAWANADHSTAIGFQSMTNGKYSTALGYGAKADGNFSVSIGKNVNVSGIDSYGMGRNLFVKGNDSFGFGRDGTSILNNTATFHNLDLTIPNGSVGIGTTIPTEKLEVYPDTDNSAIIGRAKIGDIVGTSDIAGFSHVDHANINNYSLIQAAAGDTILNAPTGQGVYMRINNSATGQVLLTSTGFQYGANQDNVFFAAGRAKIGTISFSDYMQIAHFDHFDSTGYALLQGPAGQTFLNSKGGQVLSLRINNADALVIDADKDIKVVEDLILQDDSDKLYLGGAKDVSINYNGSQTQFTNEVGSGNWIFDSGRIGIGTTIPTNELDVSDTAQSEVSISTFVNSATPSYLFLRKTRGATVGTFSPTVNGDYLGLIQFEGSRTFSTTGAIITARQDGANSVYSPTNLLLETFSSTARNTNQLVLHNDGNVGIGTVTPAYKLEINNSEKALNVSGVLYVNGTSENVGIGIVSPTSYLNKRTLAVSGAWGGRYDNMRDGVVHSSWYQDTNNDVFFGSVSADNKLHLLTDDTVRVTIVGTSGYTGFNTVLPTSTIHVVGNASIGNSDKQLYIDTDGHLRDHDEPVTIDDDLNVSGVLYVNGTSENVGIGTDSPVSKLSILGTSQTGTDGLYIGRSATNGFGYYNDQIGSVESMHFAYTADGWSSSSILMTISELGSIGIGTTTPEATSELDVDRAAGTSKVRIAATDGLNDSWINFEVNNDEWSLGYDQTDDTFRLAHGDTLAATAAIIVDNTEEVGIGILPTQKLDVNGRIRMRTWTADGDVLAYRDALTDSIAITSSDVRLKKDIDPLDNALEIINQLNAYKYHTLDENSNSQKRLGLIAQELLPILPELTFEFYEEGSNETFYGVHYDKIPVLLLKGIKEQQENIEDLDDEVNTLNDKMELLEEDLCSLGVARWC